MATKWLIGIMFMYVILTVISGISEGTYATGFTRIWQAVMGFQALDLTNPLTAVSDIMISLKDLFVGIFEVITWKFSFWTTGVWQIFRWLMFAVTVGVLVSFIMALRGTSSA